MPVCGGSRGNRVHTASGRENPHYRARDRRRAVLSCIFLDNLPEFKLWMREPSDRRPRPQPAAITAREKFVEALGSLR